MRRAILLLLVAACSRAEPNKIELEVGKAVRIDGCNVYANSASERFVTLQTSCGAPAAAIDTDQWWGNGPPPLAGQRGVGDCLLIGDSSYFCVREIREGRGAALVRSFSIRNADHRFLDRVAED